MKNFDELSDQLEKLAMAGLVNASVVHELKNPISIISICNEQILNSLEKGDVVSIRKFSKKIEDSLEEILSIINATKSLLDGESNKLLKISISDLVNETLINCKFKLDNKKVTCSCDFSDNLNPINCNKTQIKQVLSNLIFNSIDAISSLEEKWIKIKVSQNELETYITIIDSGTISDLEITKMFDPMYTTKGEAGTGIGLWLCEKIVENHNGKIKCHILDNHTALEFSLKNI